MRTEENISRVALHLTLAYDQMEGSSDGDAVGFSSSVITVQERGSDVNTSHGLGRERGNWSKTLRKAHRLSAYPVTLKSQMNDSLLQVLALLQLSATACIFVGKSISPCRSSQWQISQIVKTPDEIFWRL